MCSYFHQKYDIISSEAKVNTYQQICLLNSQISLFDILVAEQFLAGTAELYRTGFEHIPPVRELQCSTSILLYQKDRYSLPVDVPNYLEYPADHDRCQPQGWLIQKEHPGVRHKRPADGEHLLFTPAQGTAHLARPLLEDRKNGKDFFEISVQVTAWSAICAHFKVVMYR